MRWSLLVLSACGRVGFDPSALDVATDAPIDASGTCAGAPVCTSSTGRSVCGQVFGTGAQAGIPLHVANPTGQICLASDNEGPCALTVSGLPMVSLFNNTLTGHITGQIDDCGRYFVGDLDPTIDDVAIVVSDGDPAPIHNTTARLLLDRPTIPGIDRDVDVLAATIATTNDWASQINPNSPPQTRTGYLITYTLGTNTIPGIGVALDGGAALANPPGTIPWAGYFKNVSSFKTLDGGAVETSDNGTAFAVFPAGPFSLDGVRPGKRCTIPNLQSVANTLIHVIVDGC